MKRLLEAALVTFLLVAPTLAPVVGAGAPEPVLAAPYDVKNTVTGVSADARARFAAVVVNVDPTAGTLGSGAEKDVYAFDFSDTGKGYLWGERHASGFRTGKLPQTQHVAFAAGERNVDAGRFVVGGPGNVIALWATSSQKPLAEREAEASGTIPAVAITSDGARSIVAVNPASGPGRVFVYGSNLEYLWDVNLTDASGSAVKATALETARHQVDGPNVLVIGHENGLWVVDPRQGKPSKPFTYNTDGGVTAIDVNHDGRYVLVGTSGGCFYYFGPGARGDTPAPFNRCLGSAVTDVAISLDGARFAIGTADGAIHFFERLAENSDQAVAFADPVTRESKYVLGKRIVSLDYDSDGDTLIATTDTHVAGFHDSRVAPIWTTGAADLKLDTPLKGAVVSDTGDRIVIAGNTLVTALKVSYDANVTLPGGLARSALPGDTVRYTAVVKNTGSTPDTFTWRVQTPAGWSFDQPRKLTLLPDESQSVQINLTSPTGSSPGYAETVVSVFSEGRPSQGKDPLVREFVLNVSLSRIVDVDLVLGEKSLTLNQGQDVTMPFTITNRGNDAVLVNLTAHQVPSRGSSWSLRFENEQIRVGPDDSVTSSVRVTAPQDGFDGDYNRITLRARVGTTFATEAQFIARVNPEYNIDIEANATDVATRPGRTTFVGVKITNNGNTADTVNLTASLLPADASLLWRVTLDRTSVEVPRGESRTVNLGIRAVDPEATDGTITLAAVSQGSGEREQVTITMTHDASPEDKGLLGLPFPGSALALLAVIAGALIAFRTPDRRRRT